MKLRKLITLAPLVFVMALGMALAGALHAQTPSDPANLPQRDGSHDFDFLIGDWKAHVRRLPDRLNNSNVWVEYDGISNHQKLLDSNANFEEFEVTSTDKKLHIKAQTLRLYNPSTRQWSIYLVDLDNGTLDTASRGGRLYRQARRVFRSGEPQGSHHSGALHVARYLTQVGAHGTVLLAGRRQDLGSQLDLRAFAIRVHRQRIKKRMIVLPRLYPILDAGCFPNALGLITAAEELADCWCDPDSIPQ